MSIPEFNVKEQWLGTNDTVAYTFDFTIQALVHLLIIVQDNFGNIQQTIRGDDIVYLSGVTFDSVNGGGTITLQANLPTDFVLTALMANDVPTQPSEFKGKGSFTLSMFESALDFLGCQIQRLAYLAQRALVLHDIDDGSAISLKLPVGFASNANASLVINSDASGLTYGPNASQISAAIAAAAAALVSQAAAAASAIAASASSVSASASAAAAAASAATAASGFQVTGTRAAPVNVTAAGGITPGGYKRELQFIWGSPAGVTISANPQIAAGTIVGQELLLIGCDDTRSVTIANGTGTLQNGDALLKDGDTICYIWNGTAWMELYRR